VSAEKNKHSKAIGVIPIDSIFSPVRNVAFTVESDSSGRATDNDRLVLDIETDGSISPREALASAGETLSNLLSVIAGLEDAPLGLELGDAGSITQATSDLDLRIEDLDLTERPRNCLKRAQIDTVAELLRRSANDLLNITNFGQKSLDEILVKLDERGLSLKAED
jgi:DNA-directed RNA polymerase subunit alpha